MKYIIVIEDDCMPLPNFDINLERVLHYLETLDTWSIFLGGTFHTKEWSVKKQKQISNELTICDINYGYCTHLTIYNSSFFDSVLNADTDVPLDHWWSTKNNTIAHLCVPFLATQIVSVGDITNTSSKSITDRINKNNKQLNSLVGKK